MNFLKDFLFDQSGFIAVATMQPEIQYTYLDTATIEQPLPLAMNQDLYFGPAERKNKGNEKTDVLGSMTLWVDVDEAAQLQTTLPPSVTVLSGHGWHLYYYLDKPLTDIDEIERLNKILARDVVGGDVACWNVNRILRVPGTINNKIPVAPIAVELNVYHPELRYTPGEIEVIGKLSKATRHHIRTGDSRGFRSRSERDWAIIRGLFHAGASDSLIIRIFDVQPCGDKHRANEAYLAHTMEQARTAKPETPIVEGEDGWYVEGAKGRRKISTFTFEPHLLLDGTPFKAEDALVGTVRASSHNWEQVTFGRAAFTNVGRMDKQTPIAAWQFLGNDSELRQLLPYLLSKLQDQGMPRVVATPSLGLHYVKGKPYFVTDRYVLGADVMWQDFAGPIAWLPNQREHPTYDFTLEEDIAAAKILPTLHEPSVIWLMIGWYTASIIKPWLEAQTYRFPILDVVGTKGSGKTTLIERVFMPMLNQTDPKSYNAVTTRFVALAVLGSSNACPVSFSEFRYDAAEKFIRYVLLAYDTGHDPRGRADQTTVDYALSAPFSIDGEDLVEDAAARERIVVAFLHPKSVKEGSEYYEAFQKVRYAPLHIGTALVWTALRLIESGDMLRLLQESRQAIMDAFPQSLPDRVRNNHIVVALGIKLWCSVVGVPIPDWQVLERSITSVFNLKAGHTPTAADAMVEEIVNTCARSHEYFKWYWDDVAKVLYFQLTAAHSWWLAARRRQGRGTLERDALSAQLLEAAYIIPPKMVESVWMYGIDLVKAQAQGLDIPSEISSKQITVHF